MRSHQFLQAGSLVALEAHGQLYPPARQTEAPALHTALEPEHAFGDWYGRCGCGTRSLPCDREIDARAWQCCWLVAQEEADRADRSWRMRNAYAQMEGVVR